MEQREKARPRKKAKLKQDKTKSSESTSRNIPLPVPMRVLRVLGRPSASFCRPRKAQACKFARRVRYFSPNSEDVIELAKKRAAEQAVDDHVFDGCRIGIGSGSTIVYAVQRLKLLSDKGSVKFRCVPTSFQAQELIVEAGLELSDLSRTPELDFVIDGADEVDSRLNCIKGGGGCLVQEKVVAACTDTFVLIADYRKRSTTTLGTSWTSGVPVEVLPFAYVPVAKRMEARLGARSATLRLAGASKAG